jgi:histidyl-tRNA synthetase
MADFQDWLPERMAIRRAVISHACRTFETAGYREVAVPLLEEAGLYQRTSGEASEVVTKEMYSFTDRGGRTLALRPEFTPGLMRAYLEHGMSRRPQPVKVYCYGTAYRYNRTQRGRYREFVQFDVEAIGSADPAVDAELIALQLQWLAGVGMEGLELEINSIDTEAARRGYVAELRTYLDAHRHDLSDDVRQLRDTNPLRAFDTKDPGSQRVLAAAPKITDQLSDEAQVHFDQVRAFLDARAVAYTVNKTLVRGLDYYTHTAWEVKWPPLGAQSTVSGGGRYDGLAVVMGGPPTPGIGFAAGIDRIVLALEDQHRADQLVDQPAVDVFFQVEEPSARPVLHALMDATRRLGLVCDTDLAGRSAKGQGKHAERLGARLVVLCSADDWSAGRVRLRDRSGGQTIDVAIPDLVCVIAERRKP